MPLLATPPITWAYKPSPSESLCHRKDRRIEQSLGDPVGRRSRRRGDRGVDATDILGAADEVEEDLLLGEPGPGAGEGRRPGTQAGGVRGAFEDSFVVAGHLA